MDSVITTDFCSPRKNRYFDDVDFYRNFQTQYFQ